MYYKKFLFILLLLITNITSAKDYKLYYLGGQSNMDGFGYVHELSDSLKNPLKNVKIFHGNTAPDQTPVDGRGIWAELSPGHGSGFKSDGDSNSYSNRFGVELTFACKLLELDSTSNIALIKYSRGGTSIDIAAARRFGCWDPDFNDSTGINQYDHFLATIRNATAVRDIDGDGESDRLIPSGIVWMQGESDAHPSEEIARRYLANLKRLMDLIRAALRVDDLPVVIGRISDSGKVDDGIVWDYGDIVRRSQAFYVENDVRAALVTSTDNYKYSDPWHYDSKGYIDLGEKFAEAMFRLQQ
jgi:hypothetical protein